MPADALIPVQQLVERAQEGQEGQLGILCRGHAEQNPGAATGEIHRQRVVPTPVKARWPRNPTAFHSRFR